ncbi:hypothetical protein [Salinisphaera orenii]|uniref:hypothetical protein n=1 Tax=Salinisphaera orenii TaxID=856731 RepID=UPI0013A6525F
MATSWPTPTMNECQKWDMLGDPVGRHELDRYYRQRRRRVLLTTATAAALSLATLPGCSDSTTSHPSKGQQPTSNQAKNQSQSDNGDNKPDLPVDAEAQADADKASAQQSPDLTDQLHSLRQTVQAEQTHTKHKLQAQAQRIDQLEKRVQSLHKHVKKLKKPDAGAKQAAHYDKSPARPIQAVQPAALVKAAAHDGADANTDSANNSESDNGEADKGKANGDEADGDSQHDQLSAAHCADRDNGHTGFDVAYQVDTTKALKAAEAKVHQAGFSDVFRGDQRLYLGRYNQCSTAQKRRRAVYQKTQITAALDPVHQKQHSDHAHRAADSDSHRTRHGDAPFRVVSIEQHGRQQTIGVTSTDPQSLGDITWLYPGQAYRHWQLKAIKKAQRTAVFADGDHSVAVALPTPR